MPLLAAVPANDHANSRVIYIPFAGRAERMVGVNGLCHDLSHVLERIAGRRLVQFECLDALPGV